MHKDSAEPVAAANQVLNNLKVLRPSEKGAERGPSKYDIDFHGKRFMFRLEGTCCGFDLKYVFQMPAENLMPRGMREMLGPLLENKGHMTEHTIMEHHVHVRPLLRPFRSIIRWRVRLEAGRMQRVLKDLLYFEGQVADVADFLEKGGTDGKAQ